MPFSSYDRFFELAEASDVQTFRSRLSKVAESIGFPLVNATAVVAPGADKPAVVRDTRVMPSGWEATASDPADTARDPCLLHLKRNPQPFFYDREFYERHGAGDLWEKQAPFGYRTGILGIVHLPRGRHFLIGLDREEDLPREQTLVMRMLADLQFLTLFVQNNATRLLLNEDVEDSADVTGELSARQLEVLKWASAGKTAWETGCILSISEHTVNKHLTAAARQLGCTSKTQAIARAFEQGLL